MSYTQHLALYDLSVDHTFTAESEVQGHITFIEGSKVLPRSAKLKDTESLNFAASFGPRTIPALTPNSSFEIVIPISWAKRVSSNYCCYVSFAIHLQLSPPYRSIVSRFFYNAIMDNKINYLLSKRKKGEQMSLSGRVLASRV